MLLEAESSAAFIDLVAELYGPLLQASKALSESGRWPELRDDLIALSDELNTADDGRLRVASDYLVIVASKA